jgi:hypothetical protein
MSSSELRKQQASYIAEQWGPTLTKAFHEGDVSEFRSLFAYQEPVVVVLQDASGNEAVCKIVDSRDASEEPAEGEDTVTSLTWEEFRAASASDLESQNFFKTEAQCLGVLGDRLILEAGRFNRDGIVYLESYSLLTFNHEGKVTMVETFTDPQVASLHNKATAASSST